MEKEIRFLNIHYMNAIKLSDDFSITRTKEWTPLIILNELSIQIGHIYNIIYSSESINEDSRNFCNLGDELSDVILQLIALANIQNINLYNIVYLKQMQENSWFAIPVILGQINEAIMEQQGYRFLKPRTGFENINMFIENRIMRLFDIIFQIADKHNLDLVKEFSLMLEDANAFLTRFEKKNRGL